jgi:hypothetical protein
MCPIFPSQLPLPLITLRLSTASILDTVLLDAQDATPLFSIESLENRTTVHMHDPRQQQPVAEVAAIRWPVLPFGANRTKESPLVTVLGDTVTASSFLKKKSMLGGSRKFHIPGQQHPLKWKHVGEHSECTLCSHACTAHRAVATFEPAHTTSAARLAIYASTVSNTLPTSEYRGVDMEMIIYLILTAILLSTQQHTSSAVHTPVSLSPIHHQHPSPVSSMGNYKIDLLAPDEAFVPFKSSPGSSSSCYSSLPASPISPAGDLSPINNETFVSTSASTSTSSSSSCTRRQSTRHSSPRSGPGSITPYHLPPATSPPILRLQVPSPRVNNNALLLDTSAPNFYSHEQHIQYPDRHHHQYQHQHQQLHLSPTSATPYTVPPPPTEELPPAYSEIEWTVRVKQPRQALHTGLAY